jgi:hypothetical protein
MNIPKAIEQKCDSERYPDLEIRNEGSIFLVYIRTDAGAAWLGENLDDPEMQFWSGALVVEHRYIQDIVNGAIESGLKVV